MRCQSAGIWKIQKVDLCFGKSRQPKPIKPLNRSLLALIFPLIAVVIFASGCSDDETIRKVASLDARLERVEAKLARIEERQERMVLLERKVQALQQSISDLDRGETPEIAKGRYHEVRPGDNLSVIAQEYGMTVQELCRLNGITPQAILLPGQMLLVKPER
jgi:LysM repeat protein